jgi:hypothetical protein
MGILIWGRQVPSPFLPVPLVQLPTELGVIHIVPGSPGRRGIVPSTDWIHVHRISDHDTVAVFFAQEFANSQGDSRITH